MAIEFLIEYIFEDKEQSHVIAKYLTPGRDFSLQGNCFLNGVEIMPSFTQPRALYKDNTPRFDLYIFYPLRSKDIHLFKLNKIVKLTFGV